MARVSPWLDAATHERTLAAAPEAGVSVRRWVSDIVKRQTGEDWFGEPAGGA